MTLLFVYKTVCALVDSLTHLQTITV